MQVYKWTDAAIHCYERGCICRGCLFNKMIGKSCRMKESVLGLVKKFGKPKGIITKNIIEESEEL